MLRSSYVCTRAIGTTRTVARDNETHKSTRELELIGIINDFAVVGKKQINSTLESHIYESRTGWSSREKQLQNYIQVGFVRILQFERNLRLSFVYFHALHRYSINPAPS